MTTYKILPEAFSMKHVMGESSRTKLTNVQAEDIQPNAVDLRLGKVYQIENEMFEVSNDNKKHRGSKEIFPDGEGYFTLYPGSYEVVMENIIQVGEGEAGWVITRSTLNRNGCYITSGLYDSGYHGVMAGVLHVTTGPARIKQGTRVGQYLSFDAEALHTYNGSYGIGKEHDKKYT
jgi:deoxycytidine triphosphate deaminase